MEAAGRGGGEEEKVQDAVREDTAQEAAKEEDTMKEDMAENGTASLMIRVALMTTGYLSYYHPSVTVSVQGSETTYTPESPELSDGFLTLKDDRGIEVLSIDRQEGHPVYEGALEIQKREEGLLIINELPLETYLEAVVPSEMPSSFEQEALMAQAVCARTYACKQMEESRMADYGADVDDSVSYQVYHNIAPQESTSQAVKNTKGEVLCQDGELIQAYYFSTSAGATSTDEVWGAKEAASYLKSVACTFDSTQPWSSWSVTLPWTKLESSAGMLPGCSGSLKMLEIEKKSMSKAVTGLRVITEGGSCLISDEYEIREFLSPSGCTITEKDGSQTEGGVLLPSAYFSMEVTPGESVFLQGGGYGHGVGMSQNAANEMAKEGYTYEEILDYFFKDVELEDVSRISS